MEQEKFEISEEKENLEPLEIQRNKKKKKEALFEMVLFLILGILIGITLKTEAVKRFTIGFDDYKLPRPTESYNVREIESRINAETARQQAQAEAEQQIQAVSSEAQNQTQ